MLRELKRTLDEAMNASDDKQAHRLKKGIEELITSIRRIKDESAEVLESEQRVINEADYALEILDGIREKKLINEKNL